MIIHPAYDAERREWFVTLPDGALIEAQSLREMTMILRQRGRFTIKDYCPLNGKPIRTVWPDEPIKKCAAQTPRMPIAKSGGPRRYDYESILNMWAAGYTGPDIAQRLAMPNWKRIGGIVSDARKRGDPRAQSRTSNPKWR